VLSSIGGIQLSAIPGRWLDSIDRPYFGLHPQGFAVSSAFRATSAFRHHGIDAGQSRFCARARALALHPKKVSACPEVGGLSTPAKGSPAAAALPLSRPGRIREEDIKAFVAVLKKRRTGDQRPPPRAQVPFIVQTEKLSKLTVTFPPPQAVVPAIMPTFPSGKVSST
jgi:hypothetical protein